MNNTRSKQSTAPAPTKKKGVRKFFLLANPKTKELKMLASSRQAEFPGLGAVVFGTFGNLFHSKSIDLGTGEEFGNRVQFHVRANGLIAILKIPKGRASAYFKKDEAEALLSDNVLHDSIKALAGVPEMRKWWK